MPTSQHRSETAQALWQEGMMERSWQHQLFMARRWATFARLQAYSERDGGACPTTNLESNSQLSISTCPSFSADYDDECGLA